MRWVRSRVEYFQISCDMFYCDHAEGGSAEQSTGTYSDIIDREVAVLYALYSRVRYLVCISYVNVTVWV